jgi:hypothetical protein
MADVKTSAESAASALDGTELIRGVQGGGNVKITGTQVKTFTSASPTLVTPTLGVATATTINKVALTAPATSATLTITDGKTLTASDNATVSGTNTGDQTITLTSDVTGTGTGSFATTIAANAVTTAKINNGAVTEAKLTLANNTTGNVSTTAHGFAPILPNDATKYLDGSGGYSIPAGSSSVLRSYVAGLTLSNDGTTPNSVLDIAAGQAADSTNAVTISPGAFTKSTAGAWTSGTGNNGMGNGLTVAASTWYHVILANNGGTPDIYFDTSATGANRPTGISDTKVRRVGSFKTDGSSNILAFTQIGDTFYWSTVITDVSSSTSDYSAGVLVTLSVPLGLQVRPLARIFQGNASNILSIITSPSETNVAPGNTTTNPGTDMDAATISNWTQRLVYTNTSSQIRVRASTSGSISLNIFTAGYMDDRGRYA